MPALLNYYQKLLAENRLWIKRAASLALFWTAAGMVCFAVYPDLLAALRDYLSSVFSDILGEEGLVLDFSTAMDIFTQNIRAAAITLFLGVFLGIVPFLAIAVNFFILGFLFGAFFFSPLTFLAAVLPHGIIEIPAFILTAAFGLRLGFFWRSASGLVSGLKAAGSGFVLAALMFFLAALVEVFVTGRLAAAQQPF